MEEEVVIVGAGVAGLATSLGLHRLGIRSLVLESADGLRVTGSAFGLWSNAWKAADVLRIADSLRSKYTKLRSLEIISVNTGLSISDKPFVPLDSRSDYEVRCVNRRVLLETMVNELPLNTIRYSSRVVSIDTDGHLKAIHLADGTCIRAKVVVGSDGVNSVVAKFLGLSKPRFVGRSEIRGLVWFDEGHDFESKFMKFVGDGIYYGIFPCDDRSVYWFFNFIPSPQDEEELRHDTSKIKHYVMARLGNVSKKIHSAFEKTDIGLISYAALRYRPPWELLWPWCGTKMFKDNVCVTGDALHPMTPDIGQGACSALEDGVVLARILGEVMNTDNRRIRVGLEKFAKERRWRCFELVSLAHVVGWMQASDRVSIKFLRQNFAIKWLINAAMHKVTLYDCGNLTTSQVGLNM